MFVKNRFCHFRTFRFCHFCFYVQLLHCLVHTNYVYRTLYCFRNDLTFYFCEHRIYGHLKSKITINPIITNKRMLIVTDNFEPNYENYALISLVSITPTFYSFMSKIFCLFPSIISDKNKPAVG